ncbi:hypothetical protein ACIHDR_41575 [Nocardia sp. NPDC052278]|uniref:hypothetical protein n=1 Tax=unclassified Nocardia TaxID=2637762 RepID=UPI0036B30B01
MSTNPLAVQSVTRTQYQNLAERGYAGPVTDIPDAAGAEAWRAQFPDWRGQYWTYTDDGEMLRLRPVNLARQRGTRAA